MKQTRLVKLLAAGAAGAVALRYSFRAGILNYNHNHGGHNGREREHHEHEYA